MNNYELLLTLVLLLLGKAGKSFADNNVEMFGIMMDITLLLNVLFSS